MKAVPLEIQPLLPKARTGIDGLDEITNGGLPAGRPTLVCGGASCGKTMLAMEFLVRGATQYGEPGVFMMFEENAAELTANGRYDLEVVDISEHPTLAAGEQIIAAPTLIKKLPLPLRRFIGDMSATDRILVGLDLQKLSGTAPKSESR